jgi:superoxide dismutase, Cu-Zn family
LCNKFPRDPLSRHLQSRIQGKKYQELFLLFDERTIQHCNQKNQFDMKAIFRNKMAGMMIVGAVAIFASCNNSGSGEYDNGPKDSSSAKKNDTNDQPMMATAIISGVIADTPVNGTARFEKQSNGKVKMTLDLTIPSKANQTVAVHIHENADCGDNGKAAGGHWNPTNETHGEWGSAHFHSGDIGNIQLDGDGKAMKEMETDRWSIGRDSMTNILNHSIIVHGGKDDYTSQPSGNSGVRIGCGTIQSGTGM